MRHLKRAGVYSSGIYYSGNGFDVFHRLTSSGVLPLQDFSILSIHSKMTDMRQWSQSNSNR